MTLFFIFVQILSNIVNYLSFYLFLVLLFSIFVVALLCAKAP